MAAGGRSGKDDRKQKYIDPVRWKVEAWPYLPRKGGKDGANFNDSKKGVVFFFPYCCWMDEQEDGGHDGGGGLPEGGLRLRHAGRLLVRGLLSLLLLDGCAGGWRT